MLEDQDLQKISAIIDKSTGKLLKDVVDSVSDMFDNLETSLMNTLADKASVNRMIDQSIERDEKLDTKINIKGDFLAKRQTLTAGEIASLHAMKVVVTPRTAQQ